MNITASMVKELRDATNVSMMECKRALQEAEGDLEQATKLLRERGMAVAAKKATRVAKDGKITAKVSADGQTGVMLEINCETDFVTRNENFQKFVDDMTEKAMTVDGDFAEAAKEETTAAIASIGENIVIRKSEKFTAEQGGIASYIHMGGKVGVLVEFGLNDSANATSDTFKELGLDVCLHVAAANPMALDRAGIPADVVNEEKALFAKQVEGKPENIIENILKGKLNKFYALNTLLEQGFVKDDKVSITELLAAKGKELGDTVTIKRYTRWVLGEK